MTSFQPHPNFNVDGKSFRSVCPISGLPKQQLDPKYPPTGQVHEDFIFRGPEILFHDGRGEVSLGFFDIRASVIEETAKQHLGMVTAEFHEETVQLLADSRNQAAAYSDEIESLRAQVTALTLGNAEQIVQQEALSEELAAAYEELYGERYDSDDVLDLDDETLVSLDALDAETN